MLSQLAARGAQIIALVPSLGSPRIQQLVQLLRDSTNNQLIYAEECDVLNPNSVINFAETWHKGATQAAKTNPLGPSGGNTETSGLRLDALIFLPLQDTSYSAGEGLKRAGRTDSFRGWELSHAEIAARYHFVQSMLASLLLLPPERDIRIISAISPWLPTGVAPFVAEDPDYTDARRFPTWQPWCAAGAASLRWLALSKELQRRIQLLTEADKRPRGPLPALDPSADTSSFQDEISPAKRRANISVINVCLGFERNTDVLSFILPPYQPEEIAPIDSEEEEEGKEKVMTAEEIAKQLKSNIDPRQRATLPQRRFRAQIERGTFSTPAMALRYIIATLLWPLIWLFAKSPGRAANGVTWALVAPLEQPSFGTKKKDAGTSNTAVKVRPVDLYREGLPRPVQLPQSISEEAGLRKLWELEEKLVKTAVAAGKNTKEPKKKR